MGDELSWEAPENFRAKIFVIPNLIPIKEYAQRALARRKIVILELGKITIAHGTRLPGFKQEPPVVAQRIISTKQQIGRFGIIFLPLACKVAACIWNRRQRYHAVDRRRSTDRRLLGNFLAIMFHIELEGKFFSDAPVKGPGHERTMTGKIVNADIFAPGEKIDARSELLSVPKAPAKIDVRAGAAIDIRH